MQDRIWAAYIMGNECLTLYTGMTNCLPRRILEHKEGKTKGFTQKYKLSKLLYYEYCDNSMQTIIREKQIKNMSRKEKLNLIQRKNPIFADLSEEMFSLSGANTDLIPDKPE